MKIRINWKNKKTGYESYGAWFDDNSKIVKTALEDWIKYLDGKFPELDHWVEKEEEPV